MSGAMFSGVNLSLNRFTGWPSRPTRNLAKFHSTSRPSDPRGLKLQPAIERISAGAVDLHLAEHREARKAEHNEARGSVFSVERLEPFILRSVSAVARDVDDQRNFAAKVGERLRSAEQARSRKIR